MVGSDILVRLHQPNPSPPPSEDTEKEGDNDAPDASSHTEL